MILKCKSCGETFDAEDTVTSRERIGEAWGVPAYEEWALCPFCGCDDLTKYDKEEEEIDK